MNKSGQRRTAIDRLTVLSKEASTHALFAVAADGLMNLDAPPEVLRAGRCEALLRIAREPAQPLLYAVAASLSDDLKDTTGGERVMSLSVVFGSDTRPRRCAS